LETRSFPGRSDPSSSESGHRESHPVRLPGKQPCCCHTLPACAGDERLR